MRRRHDSAESAGFVYSERCNRCEWAASPSESSARAARDAWSEQAPGTRSLAIRREYEQVDQDQRNQIRAVPFRRCGCFEPSRTRDASRQYRRSKLRPDHGYDREIDIAPAIPGAVAVYFLKGVKKKKPQGKKGTEPWWKRASSRLCGYCRERGLSPFSLVVSSFLQGS